MTALKYDALGQPTMMDGNRMVMQYIIPNENRPTPANYCAICGERCLWTNFSQHYTDPQPWTVERHEHVVIISRIDALTDSQRRDALVFLSGNVQMMEAALHMVQR